VDILVSVAKALFLTELYAWLPRISNWLVRFAASRLVVDERDRYTEEWTAHLNDYPNSLVRVVHALSLAQPFAIRRFNKAIALSKCEVIASQLCELSALQGRVSSSVSGLASANGNSQDRVLLLERKVQEMETHLDSVIADNATLFASKRALVDMTVSYRYLGHTLTSAVRRVHEITDGRIHRWSEWVAQTSDDVEHLHAQYLQLCEGFQNRELTPARFSESLRQLSVELDTLRLSLMNPDIDDCDAETLAEYQRLMSAITHVVGADRLSIRRHGLPSGPS